MSFRIPLTGGFTLIPEGKHVFLIKEIESKEDFGKVVVLMETEEGYKHRERFNLLTKDNTFNEGAVNAFSIFVKTALNDFSLEEIGSDELDQLVGRYLAAVVTHEKYNDSTGQERVAVRLGNKEVATGFTSEPVGKGKLNLDEILG